MSDLRFTEDHEWIRLEPDGSATVGITQFAQDALGDLVYVELPTLGKDFAQGAAACVVESVKAAADVKMPVTARVTAVNQAVADDPSLVNSDPEGQGWIFKVQLTPGSAEAAKLMDTAQYHKFTQQT